MEADDRPSDELPLPDLTGDAAAGPEAMPEQDVPAGDGPVSKAPRRPAARRSTTRSRTTRSRTAAPKQSADSQSPTGPGAGLGADSVAEPGTDSGSDPTKQSVADQAEATLPVPPIGAEAPVLLEVGDDEAGTEPTAPPEGAERNGGVTDSGPDQPSAPSDAEEDTPDDPDRPGDAELTPSGQDDGADAAEGSDDAGGAPVTFGLLFQAPAPARAPRRTRTQPPKPPVQGTESGSTERTPGTQDDTSTDSGDSEDADPTPRRRRRGGRGRRRTGEEQDDTPTDETTGDAEADESADETDTEGDEPEESQGSGRRRTRRRRRSGTPSEGEDPPGTVTRVRQPRADRDEATGIRGSTRLEAKRQRRREGREAGRRRTVITEAEFLARRESVERIMVVRHRDARTQIAVLEDGVLVEHFVARDEAKSASMAGNVYLGRVQNVLPSMEAAFVDIGKGRNAVLYAGEVNWDAAGLEQSKARRIENALTSGQSVLVQVTKDPIGHKGARLTSQVSLPGRFLVYVPEGSMTGISRKLPDNERARLKTVLKDIVPADAGVIVRTAAEGASEAELTADVARLTKIWETITKKSGTAAAPSLLHGEPDLTVRVVRDIFNEDFTSLIVAGDDAWSTVSEYVGSVAPDLAGRLSRWTSEEDLFTHYRIDEQLAKALDRKVWLPSGGSLVIDRTEAMTVVDVNTGKFVGSGGNLEETVTKNNIEAAEEIVRQLRLRDIGGIIVIDFIDMVLESNRDLVIRRLLECLGRDRTKHQVAEVSSLGLVQMTRKRVGAGLLEVFSEPCEHCNGRGIVVHSDPVERRPGADNGAPSRPTSSRRRGRTSGPTQAGSGNGAGTASGETGAGESSEDKPVPSGPTPAQIAAAAYAAAVQASGHGEATDVASDDSSGVMSEGPDGASGDGSTPDRSMAERTAGDHSLQNRPSGEATAAATEQAGAGEASEAGAQRTDAQAIDVQPMAAQPIEAGRPEAGVEEGPIPEQPDPGQTDAGRQPSATATSAGVGSDGAADPPRTPVRRRRSRVQAPAGPPRAAAAHGLESGRDLGAPGAVQ